MPTPRPASGSSRTSRFGRKPAPAPDRLQKVLARAGVASRRAAEALITAGRVKVDGKVVTELGTRADPEASVIEVDGKRVFAEDLVYVVLHKPRNVVATMSDPEGRPTVRELLAKVPGRVYPVGRLDFATSGVLLATNDGDFAAGMLHPRKAVPKTYIVKCQGLMDDDKELAQWRKGINLEDGPTLPARVKFVRHEEGAGSDDESDERGPRGKTWFELTITEGRNQQIRRMGEATGYRVMRLARLSFAGITSEGLPPGAWRYLTKEELTQLKAEWGVPRRAVHPPAQDAEETREARRAHEPRRPARGQGGHGAQAGREGQGAAREGERERGREGGREEGRGAGRGGGRATSGGRGGGRSGGRSGGRGADRAQPAQATDRGGPRYGGGAPVRRDVNVTDDWGGGVKRGSSGSRDEAHTPRADVGGRGGRTRTTGSGGGVGAGGGGESTYRVKGRRGW